MSHETVRNVHLNRRRVDGNENGQLVDWPPKNVHSHDAALYISFPSLQDHHVKILILRFDDDVNTRQRFSNSFC